MTTEKFIKNHPFPKNGAEINNKLVRAIQDPTQQHMRHHNLELLFKNNARLVYMIYYQFNYGQDIASVMSFVYEGIVKATETFDSDIGVPFYHYAVQTIRALLQHWYNYNSELIHIPVIKKRSIDNTNYNANANGVFTYDYVEIDDFIEHEHCCDIYAVNQLEEESSTSELDQIIKEFTHHPNTTKKALEELELFNMYRKYTLKEISQRKKINVIKIRKMINQTIERLKNFNSKINNGTTYEVLCKN